MRSTKLKHWKKNLQLSLIKESSVINGLVEGGKICKIILWLALRVKGNGINWGWNWRANDQRLSRKLDLEAKIGNFEGCQNVAGHQLWRCENDLMMIDQLLLSESPTIVLEKREIWSAAVSFFRDDFTTQMTPSRSLLRLVQRLLLIKLWVIFSRNENFPLSTSIWYIHISFYLHFLPSYVRTLYHLTFKE